MTDTDRIVELERRIAAQSAVIARLAEDLRFAELRFETDERIMVDLHIDLMLAHQKINLLLHRDPEIGEDFRRIEDIVGPFTGQPPGAPLCS